MRTRLVLSFLGILLLAVAPLAAQQRVSTNAPRLRAPAPAQHHSLWLVEGRRNTVYLLGSVHALTPQDYPLPVIMERAFTNSAIVAFEADVEAVQSLGTLQELMTKARLPEGQTLREQLSPATYELLKHHLEDARLPAFMFEPLKPGVAAFALMAVELQKSGLEMEYGLDKHFSSLARDLHKQVEFFETLDFQLGLITDLSKDEGEQFVKISLSEISKMKKEIAELLQAWRTGDADKLEKLLNDDSRQAPAIFKRLIADRNLRWLPKIEQWLQGDRNVMVIVGAGHLVGKDGVVELLRKKGWRVRQL
ncbi:MAG: hypothetical protein C5B50_11540 [Verrucomicrobia bacterium]|nr:MAG: hypothetical protein C5B50_11540 [Verrucomicrobiota bacterium]